MQTISPSTSTTAGWTATRPTGRTGARPTARSGAPLPASVKPGSSSLGNRSTGSRRPGRRGLGGRGRRGRAALGHALLRVLVSLLRVVQGSARGLEIRHGVVAIGEDDVAILDRESVLPFGVVHPGLRRVEVLLGGVERDGGLLGRRSGTVRLGDGSGEKSKGEKHDSPPRRSTSGTMKLFHGMTERDARRPHGAEGGCVRRRGFGSRPVRYKAVLGGISMSLAVLAALTDVSYGGTVPITATTAQSYYWQAGTSSPSDKVKDGKSLPWFEGDPGNGVGSWIEIDFGGDKKITRLDLFAGDWQSGDNWQRANRPKELELKWSDGTTDIWTLTDAWKMQTYVPKAPKTTSSVRFKVNSLYSGTTFPDTAISEIIAYDDQPGATATVKDVKASSEFPSDADGSYFAIQAADGVVDTFWCEGNKTSDGVGEWIDLMFDAPTPVKAVQVCTGMCTLDAIMKGNAPTKITLQFPDGSTQSVDLSIGLARKDYPLRPVTAASVKVRIDAVRKGTE